VTVGETYVPDLKSYNILSN